MKRFFQSPITPWVVIGAIIIAGGLSLILIIGLNILSHQPHSETSSKNSSLVTVIPAPTLTPTLSISLTNTPESEKIEINGITIGKFVQISGTGGDGLRLRSGPGKENPPLFLGYESEVFEVKDGPKFSDGITWWFLVAPYDQTRSGWAAADFLKLITVELENPSP